MRGKGRLGTLALVGIVFARIAGAADYVVDAKASAVSFHVGTAGVLSAAGHEHDVEASGYEGTVSMDPKAPESAKLTLKFPSKGLKVVAAKEPEGDAPKVQAAMEGAECLDVAKYPTVEFKSTKVAGAAGKMTLTGELTLHGVTKPVSFPVEVKADDKQVTATGKATIKQTDFGMKPPSAAGGTVKAKDEIEMTFKIVANAGAAKAEAAAEKPAEKPADKPAGK